MNKVHPQSATTGNISTHRAKFGCGCGLASRLIRQFTGDDVSSGNGSSHSDSARRDEKVDQQAFRKKLATSRRLSHIDNEKIFHNWELAQQVAEAKARRTSVAEVKEFGKLGIHKTIGFDDFNVIRTLGEGGFGKVLLVSKKKTREDGEEPAKFALKVLNKSFIIESGNVTRAVAEKDILQYIRHPFIVQLYYAFQSPEHLFLCLTYVGGGELYTLMETYVQGGIPVRWAKFYSAEIALALHHLHLHAILYRDLKPENIMLGLDGHVCLTDFGLAMEHDEEEGMNEIAGTPCYICPDVLGDDPPTEGCDWWSFGVITYELLYGRTPFGQGMTTVETVFQDIQHGELSFPPKAPADVVGFLSGLLDRDTAMRLCMRPPTAKSPGGFRDLEEHSFFSGLYFSQLLAKEVAAPYLPTEMQVKHAVDVTSIIREKK